MAALKKFPQFNASLDGDQLVLKQYFHIAFAADTPNGLVVPVIKDADKKGILQISQEMGELAKKARDGKLSPADMQGACFTISSLGGIGGRYFTPIINAPEVAILGVCKSRIEPVWDGKAFQPRLMLPLSPELGPPRDRRRGGGAFQRVPRPDPGGLPPHLPVTTLVVVKKAGQVVIAADTLVTFGDTRLTHRFEANSKIFKVETPDGRQLHRHGRHRGALSRCCARPCQRCPPSSSSWAAATRCSTPSSSCTPC